MATKKLKEWERKKPRRPLTEEEVKKRAEIGLSYSEKPAASDPGPGPDLDADINAVDVEIDERPEIKDEGPLKGLLARAAQNLTGQTPSKRTRTRKTKASKANKEDVSTLLITLLTLGVSAWNVPPDVKPNGAEISAFSVPLTNILLRHVNLTGKLTRDALDVISMIAAGSAYYARTAGAWSALNKQKQPEQINPGAFTDPAPVPVGTDPVGTDNDPFNQVTHNPEQVTK